MAFKNKNKTGGQVEEGREGGIERARKRQSAFLLLLFPPVTALSLLPACFLANTAAGGKEQPLSY